MADELTLELEGLQQQNAPQAPIDDTAEGPVQTLALPGATPGTVQHRLETIQLVNWGGFQGHLTIPLDPESTLMSGASGSGKSTVQDAWLALLQPSDTPFNGASNDAVRGRARSALQRNLLSYLRGQTDTTEDDRGQDKAKVLRGEKVDTWGAVGATFRDDHGRRFMAFRAYYVPARAQRSTDVINRMFTTEGEFDLKVLADFTGTSPAPFAPARIKATHPGVRSYTSYQEFSQKLFTRLGIGANGDGLKALRLLARVQAGHQIRTVDELYKEMVLERPSTFTHADKAIEHFNALEDSYLAMQTEQQKYELLQPIKAWHSELIDAQERVRRIEALGLRASGDSPLTLWSLRLLDRVLAEAAERNSQERRLVSGQLLAAEQTVDRMETELSSLRTQHDEAGGGTLTRIANDIAAEKQTLQARTRRLESVGDEARALADLLPGSLGSQSEHALLQAAARGFLQGKDAAKAAIVQDRDALKRDQVRLGDRRLALKQELRSYEGRTGRIPPPLNELRHQVALAAGFPPEELPFLAELIDVADGQEQWRTAIETVLGASARRLLVPLEYLERFSRAIDPLRLTGRITFQGVPLGAWDTARLDATEPDRISGKLQFKDTPYTTWVFQHVTAPGRDALCVRTAQELGGDGYRVTLAGQTREGRRGAHGRSDIRNVIGFSNAETRAAIQKELHEIEASLTDLDTRIRAVEDGDSLLTRRVSACEAVERLPWADIDVPASIERIEDLQQRHASILDSDNILHTLEQQITEQSEKLVGARQEHFGFQQTHKALVKEQDLLVTRQDNTTNDLGRIDREDRISLDEEQSAFLDTRLNAATNNQTLDHANIDANLASLSRDLVQERTSAEFTVAGRTERIEERFQQYQRLWDDPNLGDTLASYSDYARIFDSIETTGLHRRRDEWRRRLTEWSGQDLVPLAHSMGDAVDEIDKRLVPINAILGRLPFGANANRLRIKMRRQQFEHVKSFRRDLGKLSSLATKQITDDQLEQRFKDLQVFMHQIRTTDDERGLPVQRGRGRNIAPVGPERDRDRLLDVRKHVTITAECYDLERGDLVSTHSSLGGKSGGESQELIAFIVGAALRFRLGDDLEERPRFAPVFLDEGFIKADAEFAGRAVKAWLGLGFQLIIGAPLDKVTGLEPHMNELLAITKNTRTHYSFVHPIRDRDAFRAELGTATPATSDRR